MSQSYRVFVSLQDALQKGKNEGADSYRYAFVEPGKPGKPAWSDLYEIDSYPDDAILRERADKPIKIKLLQGQEEPWEAVFVDPNTQEQDLESELRPSKGKPSQKKRVVVVDATKEQDSEAEEGEALSEEVSAVPVAVTKSRARKEKVVLVEKVEADEQAASPPTNGKHLSKKSVSVTNPKVTDVLALLNKVQTEHTAMMSDVEDLSARAKTLTSMLTKISSLLS